VYLRDEIEPDSSIPKPAIMQYNNILDRISRFRQHFIAAFILHIRVFSRAILFPVIQVQDVRLRKAQITDKPDISRMGRSLNLSREIYLLRMRDGILKSVH
jgi:hypothetical protein